MKKLILSTPWLVLLGLCFTLGLAPFNPPHLWEKLVMLFGGTLVRPIDWFDLAMHGTPWVLLIAKSVLVLKRKKNRN